MVVLKAVVNVFLHIEILIDEIFSLGCVPEKLLD